MKELKVLFETLDDGYATTQGTAYIDGELFVIKYGRGEFDVLSKISKYYTDQIIGVHFAPQDASAKQLEDHIARLLKEQEESE